MPAIQQGNTTTVNYQSDQPIRMSPEGAGEARLTFKCPYNSVLNTIPAPLTPHPIFPQLLAYESETNREDGDVAVITTIYRGVLAEDPEALTQYEFNLASTSEPIETHPLFAYPFDDPPVTSTEIQEINKALEQNRAPTGLGAEATVLYNKKLRGIDSFLRVGATFKKNYISENEPTDYSGVGYIAEPSDAPELPTSQNYLFIGYSWRKAGGVVYITEEYQASGLGGWDVDLYTPPA